MSPTTSIRKSRAAPSMPCEWSGSTSPASTSSRKTLPVRCESRAGAVIEVNAGPGLRMHLRPSHGSPRPVGQAIVDMMFPEMQTGSDSDRGRDGRQRQNDHHAADRAHRRHDRQTRGHDLHRRHLRRRASASTTAIAAARRALRRADESRRRRGRAGNGTRRHSARRARLRSLRHRRRHEHRRRRSPGPVRYSDHRKARESEAVRSSRRLRRPAPRCSTPRIRWWPRWRSIAPARRSSSPRVAAIR